MEDGIPHYHNVIVGSGAGGATAFLDLTRNTEETTLMVEEGSDGSLEKSESSVFDEIIRRYRGGGIRPILSNCGAISVGEGVTLGGGTEVNGGLFWRTPDSVIEKWRSEASFCDGDRLISDILALEQELSVSEEVDVSGSDQASSLLEAGARRLGLTAVKARRATIDCKRNNRCAVGCPSGAKQSMARTLIARGLSFGGEIWTGNRVVKYETTRSGTLRVHMVNRGGIHSTVECSRLILAAGAFESPAIIARSSKRLWCTFPFSLHLNSKVFAIFPKPVYPDQATIFTRQVQDLTDGAYLLMPTAHNDQYLALAAASLSDESLQTLRTADSHVAAFTAQIAPRSRGIQILGKKLSLRFFWVNSRTLRQLKEASMTLCELLFAAGAVELVLPVGRGRRVSSFDDAKEKIDASKARDWSLTSVHIMGSLPLPAGNPSTKPLVDSGGRLIEDCRIWVTDASILPSATIESPQATIMAFARYVIRVATQNLK